MKYMTIEQVCEALAVSRPKLTRLERAGEIPKPVLVGKTKRWLEVELLEFLKQRREQVK